jgi:hypothetical protein
MLLTKSEIPAKQIIYRYSRSFDTSQPYVALFKMMDDSCRMVVQQPMGFEAIADNLQPIQVITYDDVKWTHSKTLKISLEMFNGIYDSIVEALPELVQAEFSQGFDGDDLSIELRDRRGHECKIRVWDPHEDPDDSYHYNKVYAGFIQVLETAGLLEWYRKW